MEDTDEATSTDALSAHTHSRSRPDPLDFSSTVDLERLKADRRRADDADDEEEVLRLSREIVAVKAGRKNDESFHSTNYSSPGRAGPPIRRSSSEAPSLSRSSSRMGNSAGAIGPSLSLRSGSSLSQRSGGVSPFTPGVIPGGPLSSPLSARSRAPELRVDDTPAVLAAVEKARFAFLSDVLAAEKDQDTEKTAGLITALGTKFDRTEIAQIQDVFAEAFKIAPDKHKQMLQKKARRSWTVLASLQAASRQSSDAADKSDKADASGFGLSRSRSLLAAIESNEFRQATTSIVCFGSLAMDLVTSLNAFPKPFSHSKGADLSYMPGGKGANEAVAIGRLGCHSYLVGRVGDENFGHHLAREVMKDVDVTGLTYDPDNATGLTIILMCEEGGRKLRSTTTCPAANSAVGDAELKRLEHILADDMAIRLIIIDLNITLESAIGAAEIGHRADKFVIVRPTAVKGPDDFPPRLWAHTHILIANDYEAPQLLNIPWAQAQNGVHHPLKSLQEGSMAAQMLFEEHPHLVAVIITTAFGNVCRVRGELGRQLHIPGVVPPSREALIEGSQSDHYATHVIPHFDTKVVDAIGAADAYLGAVVAGVAHGAPLGHALVWGAAGSAISVMAPGAQAAMPSLDKLQEFCQRRGVGVHTVQMGHVVELTLAPDEPLSACERWPTGRPETSDAVRTLERMLHAGDAAGFEACLTEAHANDPDSLNKPVDFQGQTLLHLAVVYDDIRALCLLLQCDADFYIKDRYGRTPLDRCEDLLKANKHKLQHGYWAKLCLLAVASADSFRGRTLRDGRIWEPSMFMDWDVLRTTHLDDLCAARTEPCFEDAAPAWASMLLAMILLPRVEGTAVHPYYLPDADGKGALSPQQIKPMHDLATIVIEKMLDASLSDTTNAATAAATVDELVKVQLDRSVRLIHGVAYSGNAGLLKKLLKAEAVCAAFEKQVGVYRPAGMSHAAGWLTGIGSLFGVTKEDDTGPRKLSEWIPGIEGKLHDTAKRGVLHYACIGHPAKAAGNAEVVMALLEWKVNLYDSDDYGLEPLDLVIDAELKERMKNAWIAQDVFISIGHSAETDGAIAAIVGALAKSGITVWWDKGHVDGPDDDASSTTARAAGGGIEGIRGGKSWTAEIEDAMRHSKVCVVVLTKKWLGSVHCVAEAKMALSYSKPIFTIMPPVPPSMKAGFNDIPDEYELLKFAIGHLQILDFSSASLDPVELLSTVRPLVKAVQQAESIHRYGAGSDEVSVATIDCNKLRQLTPETGSIRKGWPSVDDFVLVTSSADAPDGGYDKSFPMMMTHSLLKAGVPVAEGLKQHCGPHGPSSEFWTDMLDKIGKAVLVVLLLEEGTDPKFLNKVMEFAGNKNTKCIVVPYTTCITAGGGLNYSSNFLKFKTVCFTDWQSAGGGMTAENPVYNQIFDETFISIVDGMSEDQDEDAIAW